MPASGEGIGLAGGGHLVEGEMQDGLVRKSVLVTGAADGMGRAVCERLAKADWQVLAVDLDADKLAWTEEFANVFAVVADISSEDENLRVAAEAEARFGGLNAALFNAGIIGWGGIESLSIEQFRRVLDVNLCGPVLGIRAALPLLRRGAVDGGAAIVVTSSNAGVAGEADNWAYGAAKHGVVGLVRALAREIAWEGIRINALCPGLTETGMTRDIKDSALAHYEQVASLVPLQRWAQPDEMAAVMEFLISPASSYVNGHAMIVDGGAMVGTGVLPPKVTF